MTSNIRGKYITWTKQLCIKLIREFRKHPEIWDNKHALYYNKTAKRKAWNAIGAAVNISSERCKYKMNSVMSGFRREKAKFLHDHYKWTSDPEAPPPTMSNWFAFQELAFLLDKETERFRQRAGIPFDEKYDMEQIKLILIRKYKRRIPKTNQLINLNEDSEIKPGQSLLRQDSIEIKDEPSDPVEEIMVSTEPINASEEINYFSSFMASKLKRYSASVKNSVQKAICDVIYKADQNYYENTICEKFTIIDDPLHSKSFTSD